jgi:Holliday junction resolvase RusA-like endonuclease
MNPLAVALSQLDKESGPDERLEAVWTTFKAHTGTALDRPPTDRQRKAVRDWVLTLDPSRLTWLTRSVQLVPAISLTPLEKANFISQNACSTCEPIVNEDGSMPLNTHFPINVDPWSAQADQKRSKVLKEAVRAQLSQWTDLNPWPEAICLSIISIVPRSQPRKDVDNVVKGIIDTLQSHMFTNDRNVQCLISRIIRYRGPTGYYSIHARAVHPWEADTIYDSETGPHILSGQRITET